jgi:hypothetical protein
VKHNGAVGRWRVRVGVVVVGLITVAGCASESGANAGSETIEGAPVVMSAITRPGGELPDGFTVPPGTVMLGPVMPTGVQTVFNRVPVPERGWDAVFLVTGNPYDVLDHVRADAARAGMPASLMQSSCHTNPTTETFECGFGAHSPGNFEYPKRGAGMGATITRRAGTSNLPPVSHLVLTYSRVEGTPTPPSVPAPPPMERTAKPPPFPRDWPALLHPGDPIFRGSDIEVERGTRMVGPPIAAFRGTDAVFEVVGDPEPVVDGYRKQLEHADFFPVRPPFSDPVPGTGPTTRMYQEGDGSAEAVTIPGPSGTTYLRLGVHPE